jgi:acyl CoA:acetate/3-ketoacid CoA transferase alpha subunit
MKNKVIALTSLGEVVRDGATVALGGAWFSNHPMAAARELLRAGRRDLHVISLIGSADVDLLLAGGAVRHLTFSMVTLEAFGLAPNLRRRVEDGSITITELTALSMEVALEAAGRNVPFMTFTGLGSPATSDLVELHPEVYGYVPDPFTGEQVLVVKAIKPEVTIVHALRADAQGNAQFDGTYGIDDELAKAGDTVIVTCEEIVPTEVIAESAHMTKVPAFLVDHVIEAPFGAHPTSHIPRYTIDGHELLGYAAAAGAGGDEQEAYLARLVGETEQQYRERVLGGGRDAVLAELVRQGKVLTGVAS